MDRIAYLKSLQQRKQSASFDHFLSMVNKVGNCPVRITNHVIGGKWKPVIFNLIVHDVNRFGEIFRIVEGLSKKVLTTQLKELEADGLIVRKVYDVLPQKVEYELTEKGRSFIPVIQEMCNWAIQNFQIAEQSSPK
ncbi:winged helix-turn-helix transcriptional regulator [Longitalea arenae]|uniref:winged helix-turn-helix transcriptional regulator n=1 Tax=Longitalea arenae TaxID=2812558 RepID=UPI001F073D07|nr:helix-turn-helix domain-containing protein [Longitalea arenae]